MENTVYTPPGGPPQVSAPSLFAKIGEPNLLRLCESFYNLLAQSEIAGLFPGDKTERLAAAHRQADFLIGILGGPPRYREKHGPPRMRARHLPFAIDENARKVWLSCFRTAIGDGSDYGLNPQELDALLAWLRAFSSWMVNQPPQKDSPSQAN